MDVAVLGHQDLQMVLEGFTTKSQGKENVREPKPEALKSKHYCAQNVQYPLIATRRKYHKSYEGL